MEAIHEFLGLANTYLWSDPVLFVVLGTGIAFTVWSGFSQYYAMTHGVQVIRGKYDKKDDPGAINHFQALSAALSATVGLGNIGGVAIAISLGGPGAVFWMWVVGFFGMALKSTEVTLSMLYRNTDDPDNPHGGPMWVVSKGMKNISPNLVGVGKFIGGVFCVTTLIFTVTGGNMFQAWNVSTLTESYFGVPAMATGIMLTVLVGAVIIGGIKRIGGVAGRLVPFMCAIYFLAALVVILIKWEEIPNMFALIFNSAFNPTEAQGAFLGGTVGSTFMWGMKRALFSNEAGLGSAPMAHAAAKTDEPVREGIVAGIEPFIDTIVVCTLTALVILASGAWNRGPETYLEGDTTFSTVAEERWMLESSPLPNKLELEEAVSGPWKVGDDVFTLVKADDQLRRLHGEVIKVSDSMYIEWDEVNSIEHPVLEDGGVYGDYPAANLTGHAFDRVMKGLGAWLVPLAAWLFAISTMISWSYYGEQGIIFLFGGRLVMPYRIVYCLLILVATSGLISTERELDSLSTFGSGVMLIANLPIIWLFGHQAMKAYHQYIRNLKAGKFKAHAAADPVDIIEGKDHDS